MMTGIVDVEIPTAWNGLSKEQLIAYAEYFYPHRHTLVQVKDGEIFTNDKGLFETICFGLLHHFLGLDFDTFTRLPAEEVHRLIYKEKVLNFLWETYELDKNLIEDIDVDGVKWHGPKDFAHLTFEEMRLADDFFVDYLETGTEESLNKFIATLYRPCIEDKIYGDLRVPFDAEFAEYEHGRLKEIKTSEKIAALIWFESQRDLLVENYRECFSQGDGGQKQSLATMMLNIGQGLVNYEVVRKSPALIVYADIKRVVLENRKLKQK